jgi:hypothetical protein
LEKKKKKKYFDKESFFCYDLDVIHRTTNIEVGINGIEKSKNSG